jgi:hypothetical protein
MSYRSQKLALALSLAIVWIGGFGFGMTYMSSFHPHFYGSSETANTGVVIMDCGLGFEFRGSPGFFIETECNT